ncbi:MAG: thiamine phosphate synthase [PVC group bacterium]
MKEAFGLYVILTDPVAGYGKCAEAALAEGIRFLQLRVKNAPRPEIVEIARRLREITAGTMTRLIINDDPGIAAEVDADGVHLGQEDPPLPEARKLWAVPGKIFGLSTHNETQAESAIRLDPDYIGIGPVFPTPTKNRPDPVLGLERMGEIIRGNPLTAVAIGGINEGNLRQVLDRGAVNFAAVRPIMETADPRGAIRRLMDIWRARRETPTK